MAVGPPVALVFLLLIPVPAHTQKFGRTPAQQKIDSRLLTEIYRLRGEAGKSAPTGDTGVKIDAKGRAYVDIRVEVTPAMERKIKELGGTIVLTSTEYRSIIAWIPLSQLERIAGDPAVRAIVPPSEAITNKPVR